MAIKRWFCVAALVAALGPGYAAAGQRPPSADTVGWSDRGVFVLGSLVFDIRGRFFRSGPLVDRIEDCSTGEFYCLRTRDFELVLPRECTAIAVGDVWRAGGAETHILYHDASRMPPVTYLGNPRRRSVVYHYGLTGVGAIYWDHSGETDLVAMAIAGSLDEWMRSPSRRHAHMYYELITFDSFGPCRRENSPSRQTAEPYRNE